jgi:hypothetical protein
MKTSSTLLLILLSSLHFALNATNYTNNGTTQSYSLNAGDTLRIANGVYRGNINSFQNGAVITVSPGATFKPNNFNVPQGKIINNGTCEFGSLSTYSNFKFENYNLLVVTADLTLQDGTTQTWNNHPTATIRITGNFAMNNAVFTNYATMNVGNNFAMYTATANYINRGLLTINGDLSISNGILDNENRIIVDDFNAWGGQVINEGEIKPKGGMTFSSGTNYTNQCLMITDEGFTNYGNFTNNGLIWVGRSGTANDHFYSSGTFTNAANAVVRTIRFTNYNIINGGGSYYITGDSYTSGTVGRSGTTTDSIKVYDVTRANASRIFDVQWGTVHANVVYRSFAQPDTNNVNYAGCSSYYRTDLGTLLPIEWNYFDARLIQNRPELSWSARFEANMKFDVERSYDNVTFNTIGQQVSNSTKKYFFTDDKVEGNTVVYYRIKATSAVNGSVKYTQTKTVKMGATALNKMSIYPNPVKQTATIQFQWSKSETLLLRISNAAGQVMFVRTVSAAKGQNSVTFAEATKLNAGVYFVDLVQNNKAVSAQQFIKE